ncbi:MAG: PaaI family thioesterase [Treponemataceae bacterium]|nr:PaaI family thioesterase [Treponemataceae bacterium]
MVNENLKKAREFFYQDLFSAEAAKIQIDEVGDHYAKCSFEIGRIHQNAYGGVMGGAIFTLADFTFAVASNFNAPQTVSVTSQITYLGMAKGKKLIGESKLIKDGRTTCFYEIDITDDLGTKVAFVSINGMKLEKRG